MFKSVSLCCYRAVKCCAIAKCVFKNCLREKNLRRLYNRSTNKKTNKKRKHYRVRTFLHEKLLLFLRGILFIFCKHLYIFYVLQ